MKLAKMNRSNFSLSQLVISYGPGPAGYSFAASDALAFPFPFIFNAPSTSSC